MFEAASASRDDELKAIAAALEALSTTGAAKARAPELAQLASRVSSLMQQVGTGDDPFAKVKSLIGDLLEKLTREADAEATAKEKCDKDLAGYKAKKDEQTSTADKLSATIATKSARS